MWCKHSASSCRWASTILATALLAAPVAPAQAAQCLEVEFQDSATVGSTALVLNGLGLRKATMFNVKVYVAGLYLPATSTDANAILAANQAWRLEMRFVRDVDASDIADAWEDGFEKSTGNDLGALRERLDALKAMMVDFKEGHSLVFASDPPSGVTIEVQAAVKGAIAGADFAAALLGIWFGAEPPNDDLKSGLLGGACE